METVPENLSLLQKQRKAVEVLKRDNAAFKEELRLEKKHSVAPAAASGSILLAQLQAESDTLTRKIGMERSKLAGGQEKIKVLKKKVESQRQTMGGLSAARQQDVKANRTVKQQENRLQVAWQTRNEALAATSELRARIEGLRSERLACSEILKKSDTALEESRSALAVLLTESANASAQREKMQHELHNLQSKVARLSSKSETEWNQLSHIIQQDRQARELSRQTEIEERDRRTHALVNAEIGGQRRATAVGWGLARNKAAQNASATRMAQLTEDFATVQAATGTNSPEELAQQLLAAEDTKFRMFSFVNELNAELELLEAQIGSLEAELKHARTIAEEKVDKQLAERQAAEDAIKAATDEAETYERRAAAALHKVTGLRGAVAELFAAAACDYNGVDDLLGTNGVTANNVMQYLGIIEQKAIELVQALQAATAPLETPASSTRGVIKANLTLQHKNTMHLHDQLLAEPPSIHMPGTSDVHTHEDDGEPMLDSKALQAAAEKALQRRMHESHGSTRHSTAKSVLHR